MPCVDMQLPRFFFHKKLHDCTTEPTGRCIVGATSADVTPHVQHSFWPILYQAVDQPSLHASLQIKAQQRGVQGAPVMADGWRRLLEWVLVVVRMMRMSRGLCWVGLNSDVSAPAAACQCRACAAGVAVPHQHPSTNPGLGVGAGEG